MTTILGLNAFHGDAAACIVRDGALIAAAEEERFRRVKHWAGFPTEAIRYCLDYAGIGLANLDHVALNHDPRANLGRKLAFALSHRPDPRFLLDRLRNKQRRAGAIDLLHAAFPGQRFNGKLHYIEHHRAHLSSAFHASPFDDAVVVSVDGFGDFASGAWGAGRGTQITVDGRVFFPHSLGIFYQAITQHLGFPNYGDEYKVMGLAPYGSASFAREMSEIVHLEDDGGYRLNLDCFRHHREKIDYTWDGGEPRVGTLYAPALERLLGPARNPAQPIEQRHRDIARSAQGMYETAFFHLLSRLHARHRSDNVAIAGGCGMNSVANGKVTTHTPFRNVYVQAAAGDAGGAIGAALSVWHDPGGARSPTMDHAYWGPSFDAAAICTALDARTADLRKAGCSIDTIADDGALCRTVARSVADGNVVGWFQGRMEWGPRALGNRSIVCDPRRADMKDILNAKIKRRESFRPFAPSILRECVADWFEQDGDVPFMMQVYPIRPDRRAQIPAVTHVDGSGRLQTVERRTNPRYHGLISAFRDITGVPMVLNTSFNENEPVVCQPSEALDCFLRTEMDVLVMGDYVVKRGGARMTGAAAGNG